MHLASIYNNHTVPLRHFQGLSRAGTNRSQANLRVGQYDPKTKTHPHTHSMLASDNPSILWQQLPATAGTHFYKQSVFFNPFVGVAVLYTVLAGISITCLRPIPILNRGLPQIQELPTTKTTTTLVADGGVGTPTKVAIVTGYVRLLVPVYENFDSCV